MSAIVLAFIADETAKLERLVAAPSPPLGYGVDLICTNDVTKNLDEEDPMSAEAIARATYRRLITERGGNPDDPDYGRNVVAILSRGITADDARAEAGQIKLEVEKDDRIESAAVTLTPSADGKRVAIEIVITPIDPTLGAFPLVIAVTDGAALLDAISGRAF